MFLLLSSHRALGARGKSRGDQVSLRCLLFPRGDPCPDVFCAYGFHYGIISLKVPWSPGLLGSDVL